MLDTATTTRRRSPGRHRKTLPREHSEAFLALTAILRATGAWFASLANKIKRDH